MLMRQSPSTSTRTVPSGNFTIFFRRETHPTVYRSSGVGSATSPLRCSTAPNKRSPATMSSMSLRLGPVSSKSGTTAPGKITISASPRIGRISGKERVETRDASSVFSAAPRMLTNSVSGDVVVIIPAFRPRRLRKVQARSCPFADRNFLCLGLCRPRRGHFDAQEAVQINGFGLAQIIACLEA